MKARKIHVDGDGIPNEAAVLSFDWKASPLEVMTAVNKALTKHRLEVVQLLDSSDTYHFAIEPLRLSK